MTEHKETLSSSSECSRDGNTLSSSRTSSLTEELPNTPGSGIIRRRSIRRRISRDDGKPKTYGQKKEEYEKIVERVMTQKTVVNAVETLKERWKMLMFMYEDCMEMIKNLEEKQEEQKTKERRIEIGILITLIISAIIPIVLIVWNWG